MRRSVQRRVLNVIAAVDAVREQHAEFARPATPRTVWRVLAREGIEVRRGRIRRKARSSKFDGDAVITLRSDLSPRVAWKWALHEYGHLRLHFPMHGEFERNISPCRAGDPREDEATLFALLLVLGPTATPETPEVAAFVAKMTAREFLERRPAQLEIEMPEPAPQYRPPAADNKLLQLAYEDELAFYRRTRRRARVTIFRTPTVASEDLQRIKYFDESRGATRFTDIAGRHWWIYNYRLEHRGDRRLWIRERDFMSRDIRVRLFVNAGGERRAYVFSDRREIRAYRVKHLDRQLAYAKRLSERMAEASRGSGVKKGHRS
ncbi:MAG TPA: hypothetical protein VHB25_12140 [Gemmatimonadaceae bacterium]|nr:hypothetical protein [Gemmatimonadaceae bacterium]